jgi:hypothetical protein
MAGTLASEIMDIFLTRVDDYKLTAIYQASGSLVFINYVEPWLIDATVEFIPICDQDLTYTVSGSTTEGYFTQTLTTENKSILSQLMVKYFLAKTIQETLQLINVVNDKEYRTFSPAQNLSAKKEYYALKVEELDQLLGKYALRRTDFTSWNNQVFV